MSTSPTISVRALSSTGDPLFGNDLGSFVFDIDAIAQICKTTLLLLTGEWFLNLQAGLAVFPNQYNNGASILNYPGSQQSAASALIQAQLLTVPYVTAVTNIEFLYSSQDRMFIWAGTVQTVFGPISLATSPGQNAILVQTNSSVNLLTG